MAFHASRTLPSLKSWRVQSIARDAARFVHAVGCTDDAAPRVQVGVVGCPALAALDRHVVAAALVHEAERPAVVRLPAEAPGHAGVVAVGLRMADLDRRLPVGPCQFDAHAAARVRGQVAVERGARMVVMREHAGQVTDTLREQPQIGPRVVVSFHLAVAAAAGVVHGQQRAVGGGRARRQAADGRVFRCLGEQPCALGGGAAMVAACAHRLGAADAGGDIVGGGGEHRLVAGLCGAGQAARGVDRRGLQRVAEVGGGGAARGREMDEGTPWLVEVTRHRRQQAMAIGVPALRLDLLQRVCQAVEILGLELRVGERDPRARPRAASATR